MSQNPLSLKVLEAYTRDVGRGVARIDYDSMDNLGASTGDVIEIKGKRRTVAKCLPLYPSDEGKGIIRIDGLGRNNFCILEQITGGNESTAMLMESYRCMVVNVLSEVLPRLHTFTHTVVDDTNTLDKALQYHVMHHLVPKSEVSLQEKLAEPV